MEFSKLAQVRDQEGHLAAKSIKGPTPPNSRETYINPKPVTVIYIMLNTGRYHLQAVRDTPVVPTYLYSKSLRIIESKQLRITTKPDNKLINRFAALLSDLDIKYNRWAPRGGRTQISIEVMEQVGLRSYVLLIESWPDQGNSYVKVTKLMPQSNHQISIDFIAHFPEEIACKINSHGFLHIPEYGDCTIMHTGCFYPKCPCVKKGGRHE